jgi:hypothetical protein
MTRDEWDKLTANEQWEYVQELEFSQEENEGYSEDSSGDFDYKFVVHEIEAASERAEQERIASREKTRLFWEQYEKEHPR